MRKGLGVTEVARDGDDHVPGEQDLVVAGKAMGGSGECNGYCRYREGS